MGKYAPLKRHLERENRDLIRMTFADIEQVIGEKLPASRRYPAWWSNNPSNNVMTREWLAAGYETEQVDIAGEKLVFRRTKAATKRMAPEHAPSSGFSDQPQEGFMPASEPLPASAQNLQLGQNRMEALLARVSGLVTLAPGFDPAEPWDDGDWPEPYSGLVEER